MNLGASAATPPGHPIQVVARRTGLTPDLLRAWEKRYRAVVPFRSSTGRRLYTDADISRLLLLRRATLAGRSISQVAALPDPELAALVEADERAASLAPPAAREPRAAATSPDPDAEDLLARCRDAVQALDAEALEAALGRATVALTRPATLQRVLGPLLREIGERWRGGSLRIAHEHLATAVVRSFLGGLRETYSPSESAPRIVIATPAGQLHELGALMAAAIAAAEGWRVCYLGANLPVEEIAATALQHRPRAVALSLVYPADDPRLPGDLRRLRRELPEGTALLVGGQAADAQRAAVAAAGATPVEDFDSFGAALRRLRA